MKSKGGEYVNEVNTMDESKVKTERVGCKLCRSNKNKLFLRTDNIRRGTKKFFDVTECLNCGFRFTNPVPTKESMKLYYEGYESLRSEKLNLMEKMYYRLFRMPNGVKKGKILDVGCGNGKYLYFLKKLGINGWGVDLYEFPDYLKKDFTMFNGELYDIDLKGNFFDGVTLWWSIEHFEDPLRVMKECYRILKKGGMIIIGTSNSDSFESKWFKRYWHHLVVPEHYSQFTEKTLGKMAEKAGFKVIKVRHDLISFGFINSIQHYLKEKNKKIKINNLAVQLLFVPIDIIASLCKKSALITLYGKK